MDREGGVENAIYIRKPNTHTHTHTQRAVVNRYRLRRRQTDPQQTGYRPTPDKPGGSPPLRFRYKDGAAMRRERLRRMERMLHGAGILKLDRFMANYEIVEGVTNRTAKSYLDTLTRAGRVFVDEARDLICHTEDITTDSIPRAPEDHDPVQDTLDDARNPGG